MSASGSLPALSARAAALDSLRSHTFDVLIIGGGITGAAIARDAALRGLSVLLVDKGDFASGTSSHSARIVHGGLRYIASLQFGVVVQASAERHVLHRLAPHQVTQLSSTVPLPAAWVKRLELRLGLWLYDLLTPHGNNQPSRVLNRSQFALAEPHVVSSQGRDAIGYWERTTDDARLTLTTVQSAQRHGALALNYAEVVGLLTAGGAVAGAAVRDTLAGETYEARAARVINATGPWNDAVRALDEPGGVPSVRPNKGIHVVVPRAAFPITGQVIFLAADGRRRLYALPWRNTSLIGTTDTDYSGDLDAPHALADEVGWLLDSANQAYHDLRLTPADVVSTFAGLRPLADGGSRSAYRASRDHHIGVSASGLISICGGKLTTCRAMAQDVMDVVVKQLGRGGAARTASLPLDEGLASPDDVSAWVETAAGAAAEMDDDILRYLVATYGSRCLEVLKLAADEPALAERLVPGLPYLWAEVPYAVEHDMVFTLRDVLVRRTRLIHEAPGQGLPLAPAVAARMAPLLGWDAAETARQVQAYAQGVALTRRFDPAWSLPEAFRDPA